MSVRARVASRDYDGTIPAVTGVIPGKSRAEIVLVAHLFEPGANDNASGCGAVMELARTIIRLTRAKRLPPLRMGIRLLLPMEFNSTLAFLLENPGLRERTVAGIVPDMVGEDQSRCGSALLCQTTPDAAPSFMNTVLRDALSEIRAGFGQPRGREREPYWHTADRDYWGNDCFISEPTIGIPTVGLIEWPDRYYHSSTDTPDKLSHEALARNAALVGAMAVRAASMTRERASSVLGRIVRHAVEDIEKAATPALDAPEDADAAARMDAALELIVEREAAALGTVVDTFARRSRDRTSVTRRAEALTASISRAAEEVRTRHRDCGGVSPAPEPANKAARRARSAVPRRLTVGDVHFRNLPAPLQRKLARIRRRGLPQHLLMWVNGERTVADIVRRCRAQGRVAVGNVLAYLDLLVELGHIGWDAKG